MTDWEKPTVILWEYHVYVNVIYFLFGLYIWEIIVSLHFDYDILTRKRHFRPSFLLYLGARWFPLVTITLEMVGQDEHYHMDCQSYLVFSYLFIYLAFLFASSLIVLRIVAIWELNKIVITIAAGTWLSNLSACIYCVATSRAIWIAPFKICGIQDVLKAKFSIISILSSEVVLFVLMLTGLLRWKNRGKGGLWHLLFSQGLVWVIAIVAAEVPPLVLILLNLNIVMDVITHLPSLCILSIAATRMYRGLSDYLVSTDVVHSTHVIPGDRQTGGSPFMKFIAPSNMSITTDSRSMPSGSHLSAQIISSLTVASSDDAVEDESLSMGDGDV